MASATPAGAWASIVRLKLERFPLDLDRAGQSESAMSTPRTTSTTVSLAPRS
jgi:hypothetical protein